MFRKLNIKNNLFIQSDLLNTLLNNLGDVISKTILKVSSRLFKNWEIQFLFMGFLLGRAMILNEISPFAIPFFAVIYHLKRDKLFNIALTLIFGAYFSGNNQLMTTFIGILLFFLLQKWFEKLGKSELSYTPFLVSVSIVITNIFFNIINQTDQFNPWLISVIEGILGFVLTLIFVQAMPVLIYKREGMSLNQEEIIALTIVLASVMTGTIGWSVNDFSIEHIMSRYFILIFALVGGGAIGASVGVVTGLILSLSNPNAVDQISLLAFSGLLAGMLKQANKLGVALGLLLGTTILSIYLGNQILQSFSESTIALLLFLLTPKSVIEDIAKYIPGTHEYHSHYQNYVSKIRDISSQKIEQFSNMFSQMAISFKEINNSSFNNHNEQIDYFINKITETNCNTCWKRETCWNENFFKTYRLITELMTLIETNDKVTKKGIPREWIKHCVKSDQITFQLLDIYQNFGEHLYWKTQLEESRLLVAHQLYGVSKIMKDLALEIQKEGKKLDIQEQQIQQSLEKLGLSVRQVNIVSLDTGNVKIEVTQPNCNGTDECDKVVAPLISEVVGENIIVKRKQCEYGTDGMCKICLNSAKTYEVETGYANAALGGKWLSGDSYSTIEVNNRKLAVALSDGMGNGERAQRESKTTLELLQQLLHSGIDETISIKTINSVLLLRSQEEIFSTIDLAIIDLFNGKTRFLKVGSTPSFIKRGNEIIPISSSNLPIGIIQDIDIDSVEYNLLPEDLLIMMTDGVYESKNNINNRELWMKRNIQDIQTKDPQEFADLLLERVIRSQNGEIKDDMTIVVSRIEEFKPKWESIKMPGLAKIERENVIHH